MLFWILSDPSSEGLPFAEPAHAELSGAALGDSTEGRHSKPIGDRRRNGHPRPCAGVEGKPPDFRTVHFRPNEQMTAGRLPHFEPARGGRIEGCIARQFEIRLKGISGRRRRRRDRMDSNVSDKPPNR